MTGIRTVWPVGRTLLRTAWRSAAVLGVLVGLNGAAVGQTPDAPTPRTALRVCQDPNNMPFSNLAGEGIENRLAELFGKSLGLPVTYFSFPQRLAFIRNTLRYKLPGEDYRCDIVMGVPVGYDQVSVTKPLYRSTYAMVLRKGQGMDHVTSAADFLALDPAVRSKLRIGVYDRSPASEWLSRHNLTEQGVPYQTLNADPAQYPGEIIEKDLAAGKIDAAIVWGPIAGYFAQRVKTPALMVVPMKSEPGVKFDYQMAIGVRYGEREWKQQVEGLIEKHRDDIRRILQDFGVPLVDQSFEASPPK